MGCFFKGRALIQGGVLFQALRYTVVFIISVNLAKLWHLATHLMHGNLDNPLRAT